MDILEPGQGRGPDNVIQVGEGGSDFCLTSVHHYLTAWSRAGDLAARFVAVIVRRSPVAALVLADSDVTSVADLPGRRVAGSPDKAHMLEFEASLRHRGLGGCEPVPMDAARAREALVHAEVDALVEFVDALPRIQRLAGAPLRAVPVGLDVYASGLVAADRLATDLVTRMRDALVASLSAQRANPDGGVDELLRRYPQARADEAREGWRLVEPYIFGPDAPGSMSEEGWRRTLDVLCAARSLEPPAPQSVFRSEFVTTTIPQV